MQNKRRTVNATRVAGQKKEQEKYRKQKTVRITPTARTEEKEQVAKKRIKQRFRPNTMTKSQRSHAASKVRDEFRMDISTPRTGQLSEEAAARVRAKVQAKLSEREARKRQLEKKAAVTTLDVEQKKSTRRVNPRVRSRNRGHQKNNKI